MHARMSIFEGPPHMIDEGVRQAREVVLPQIKEIDPAFKGIIALTDRQGEAVGPEGGNPGQGVPQTQEEHPSAGESGQKPLPFGGTEPEAGFNNAPPGVVCTAPGSPFHPPEGC